MIYTKNKIENENNERAVFMANFVAISFSRGFSKYINIDKITGIIDAIDTNQKLIC
jgi:hypothetical protein